MKIQIRDLTSLPIRDVAIKSVYAVQRRLGRAPEHAAARRLRVDPGEVVDSGERVKVLVYAPRDWSVHIQWLSVVSQALRLRGASVDLVGCGGDLEICDHNNCYRAPPMPCGSCTRYAGEAAEAYGLNRTEVRYGAEADGWPELEGLTVEELYEVEWEGVPLGRLCEIPSQWFNMTTRIHEDPLAAVNTRRFLRSGRRVLPALAKHLDRTQPDVVLLFNGFFFFDALLWELCKQRGIEVVAYEAGFVPGTMVFSRNEAACRYDQRAWWDEWAGRPLTPEEDERLSSFAAARRTGGQTRDAYWRDVKFEEVERCGGGSLAVMFTNLTWDTAVIGRQRAFENLHQWIETTIRHFATRPSDQLIIRIHPAELKLRGKVTREPVGEAIWKSSDSLPENVRIIEADDTTSSYTLMDQADIGLVYTSTTGMELAMAGTPVLVAGETHYRDCGFTEDAEDPEDYASRLRKMLDDPTAFAPDRDRARRYANLFLFVSPFAMPFVAEPAPSVPRLTISSADELKPGRFEPLDRLCEDILTGGDFRPPPQ